MLDRRSERPVDGWVLLLHRRCGHERGGPRGWAGRCLRRRRTPARPLARCGRRPALHKLASHPQEPLPMPVVNRIAEFHEEMTRWRREMHAHPETAFEEEWTSDFIAARLAEIGVDHIERGIARTGIVATISGRGGAGGSGRAVGLRADFDALDVTETTGKPWAWTLPGKMHACGHEERKSTRL